MPSAQRERRTSPVKIGQMRPTGALSKVSAPGSLEQRFSGTDAATRELERLPVTARGRDLAGVLLVVPDVTAELERLKLDAEQREIIGTFEQLIRARAGTSA